METLVPLTIAVPLLAAAGIAATATFHPRRPVEVVATGAAAGAGVLTALLVVGAGGGWLVYWFAGWEPEHGIALGIDFAVDPFGAGLAALACFLVSLTFVFGWHYFDDLGQTLFHALMLVFLAALVGFSLTGDLFNLFVFFELATVPAVVLTAYMNEEKGPLQGATNFAVTNTLGAFLVLTGIALVYGRTGALNLAQIGEALAGQEPDGLVVVAFALLVCGFFVKAAVVPFHFWLADAYAVAPTPICVLFSGIMSELGLYAVARVYWTSFSGVLGGHETALREILVAAGLATALVGGLMALRQRNLKRLLAFATVAHVGLFLIGIGLLSAEALAGAAVWVLADGLVRGALFMCVGLLAQRFGSVDDADLQGRGRSLRFAGALYLVGAFALATLPPFGTFLGKSLVEGDATRLGYGWIPVAYLLVTALTAGAAVRGFAVVFLGWGPRQEEEASGAGEEVEEEGGEPPTARERHVPVYQYVPPVLLIAVALALGLVPDLASWAVHAAERFQDRESYASLVLHGREPEPLGLRVVGPKWGDVAWSLGASALAVALALLAVWRRSLPLLVRRGAVRLDELVLARATALQSGHVGDYVAWLTLGTAVFGAAFVFTLR